MMGNHWRLVGDWSPIDRRTVADQTMFTKMSPTSFGFRCCNEYLSPTKLFWQPIADWSAIIDNHLPTTENLRKPPKKKVVVGGRWEVVDVILWQPIADWSAIIDKHLPTSDNLRQPPKKVVVRGRWLVVAIVWLGLNLTFCLMIYFYIL